MKDQPPFDEAFEQCLAWWTSEGKSGDRRSSVDTSLQTHTLPTLMSDPPADRIEFLIRFGCAAMFFGCIMALIGIRFIDSIHPASVAIWGLLTISISLLAALRGDGVWRGFAGFIRWW